ncbi:MAG: plastocyanin/azurin family copper-binding protein [Alphaproteobacteria bacterium]|jgi:pseudoazurin|tara:strand:- start:794 stop:1243 length:450 start_codon:yes stop_codon:yes gene_type:complete
MKKILFSIILCLGFSIGAFAKDIITAETNVIEMLNKRDDGSIMVYSVDIAKIAAGETITWMPKDKMHNVEMLKGPDGAKLPKKSKFSKEFSMTFDVPGIYVYRCTPHVAMGMIAIVIVGGDVSNKEAISNTRMMGKAKKKLVKLLESVN